MSSATTWLWRSEKFTPCFDSTVLSLNSRTAHKAVTSLTLSNSLVSAGDVDGGLSEAFKAKKLFKALQDRRGVEDATKLAKQIQESVWSSRGRLLNHWFINRTVGCLGGQSHVSSQPLLLWLASSRCLCHAPAMPSPRLLFVLCLLHPLLAVLAQLVLPVLRALGLLGAVKHCLFRCFSATCRGVAWRSSACTVPLPLRRKPALVFVSLSVCYFDRW